MIDAFIALSFAVAVVAAFGFTAGTIIKLRTVNQVRKLVEQQVKRGRWN